MILWTFLVLNQFHPGFSIQVSFDYFTVEVVTKIILNWSIAGVAVAGIKTDFLLLTSIPKSVAVRVVWPG